MLNRLVAFSLSQRLIVLVLAALVAGLGLYSFVNLPIDAFPDISPTQVKIILKAPGMTPEEVENRVIVPLEAELLGVPRQTILRAMAKYAIADLTIDFEEGTDVYWARAQVNERLTSAMGSLPPNVSGGMAPISTPLSDVFMVKVEGGDLTLEQRRTLLDWTVRPALRTISGVADVNVLGGFVRVFEVVPDTAALAAARITLADLGAAIEAGNRNDGSGRISVGEDALVIRTVGALVTTADLEQIVIKTVDGKVVRVGDVSKVQIGALTRYGAVTSDGKGEAVEAIVISLRGADASALIDAVRAKLEELKPSLPAGVNLTVFYDRADLIQRAVETVMEALLEATLLVVLLLYLFLGNLRASLVVAVTLPFAALITFFIMQLYGMSANLMSLGGLAIAIGMLVDGAVVVVENAVERLSHHRDGSHLPVLHRIYQAGADVAVPVAAGILIICLVFLPLLSLQGLEGKLFSPVALTIVFALSGSLILSLTLIPVLSSYLLRAGSHREALLMRVLTPAYRHVLDFAFRHRMPVYVGAGAMLGIALVAYVAIGKTFMPTMDEGAIILQTTRSPSINLDRSVATDTRMQEAIMQRVPEVLSIVARVGTDEIGLDPMGLNESDLFMVLRPKAEWRRPDKEWLIDQIRAVMTDFPGINYAFTQPIEMRTSEMLTGSRGDLAVKIFGPDLATLGSLAQQVRATISRVAGAREVVTVANDQVEYLEFAIDRVASGRTGLNINTLQDELRSRLEGTTAGIVNEPGRRTAVVIRGADNLRTDPELFARAQLVTPDGGLVRIGDVAKIERTEGRVRIDRENASRFAVIQAYVGGRDLVGFVQDAQAAVAQVVTLPMGYRIAWSGEFENQRRAMARLAIVVPVALGLIFFVLFITLGSVRQAVLILANVPFALVGGIVTLWLSGEYLSVPASVGFIALLGIAVLNGLVMVSHFNQLLGRGFAIDRSVLEGSVRRLRPVLMTASITAFGLIPLLFASGPGSEIQRPLAIVVIGGLVSSTVLTLVLLPILFARFGLEQAGRAAFVKDAVAA